MGAHVYGISRDSRFAHAAFKQAENLQHSLLADVKGDVARAYDTWNADVGAAERLTVGRRQGRQDRLPPAEPDSRGARSLARHGRDQIGHLAAAII